MPTFIGIDLSWKGDKNHSGGAVLYGEKSGLTVQELSSGLETLADVEAFIDTHTDINTVIAVDAPLIINNINGQRPCETKIGKQFGIEHASAHTSNQKLYPNACSIQLAKDLEDKGFLHCPQNRTRRFSGKWFFEVYPHPAHVVLFRREKIIKYKKGRVDSRRSGLAEFRQNLEAHLSVADPPLKMNAKLKAFINKPLEELKGKALKNYEDILDAILCAYLAAFFWTWSYDRNEMIGDMESGYIINPLPEPAKYLHH